MNRDQRSLPWFLIALDGVGAILLVMGVLGLTGIDFGYPVLQKVAPVFLIIGVLLMAPLLVWVVRKAKSG